MGSEAVVALPLERVYIFTSAASEPILMGCCHSSRQPIRAGCRAPVALMEGGIGIFAHP